MNAVHASPANQAPSFEVSLTRVIRSEWIKFRSVRSTVITVGLAAVAVAAFGILISLISNGRSLGADETLVVDPAGNSLFGANVAQIVLGVLGALLFTSEYATGMIRATLSAVPTRLPVLWAKAIVVAAATFTAMLVAVGVAFFAGQALYRGDGVGASLSDPGVPLALLGAAVSPTVIAVMGVAFGALMRHTATAVGILVAVLFILPMLLQMLGGFWVDLVSYLPSDAGRATMTVVDDPQRLSPGAGFAVMAGWVAVLLAGAAVAIERRDA